MRTLAPMKAQPMDGDELQAWFAGRIPRRLLAIPFGGPIPKPGASKGTDLDGEWFSERTDIKPAWLPFRVVDWHHGKDATMGRTALGKADNLVMDDEGWWADLWLQHGEKRVDLVRRLVERGGQLYGSSESIAGMTRKAGTGEILVWPYWRQTLTTSPQNTGSVLRPAKAALEDALSDYTPSPAFWADFSDELRNLGADLRLTSIRGDDGAKAGRVLSSVNEADIAEALEVLIGSTDRLRQVLARHRKEQDQA